ncbi:ParA family protein [Pleionea sp. CnH1-48]|uniref:ParA family protein n=1 Tax=Pleionea sp. CnH1-48 TaxID=2954494 RepID=UPI00273A5AE9|nr:ParA family protein [Pleionea sp. CnH1-48]
MISRILIANTKGGCGKTTLSVNLAAWFALQQRETLLIDCDRQLSASDWLRIRPASLPCVNGQKSALTSIQYPPEQDVVVIDAPAGCSSEELLSLADAIDVIIVPVLPSAIDVRAAFRFFMDITKAGVTDDKKLRLGFVANRVKSRTKSYRSLETFLSNLNMPFISQIRDTQNYNQVMENGKSIFEMPLSRVKKDINQWESLISWVLHGKSE